MSDDTLTVTLTRPIEVDGKTVASLTLRRPLVKDLIAAERQPGEIGQDAYVLSACSGLPFEAVGRIDAGDYRRIMQESDLAFFSGGAGTQAPFAGPGSQEGSGEPSSSSTASPTGASPTASA